MTYHYETVDNIRPGDILPDVSRFPVSKVITHPFSHIRIMFKDTTFIKDYPYGDANFGWPSARFERT